MINFAAEMTVDETTSKPTYCLLTLLLLREKANTFHCTKRKEWRINEEMGENVFSPLLSFINRASHT